MRKSLHKAMITFLAFSMLLLGIFKIGQLFGKPVYFNTQGFEFSEIITHSGLLRRCLYVVQLSEHNAKSRILCFCPIDINISLYYLRLLADWHSLYILSA